jgi:hypothetical protein
VKLEQTFCDRRETIRTANLVKNSLPKTVSEPQKQCAIGCQAIGFSLKIANTNAVKYD